MGPFVMKYWSGDEVMLFLGFSILDAFIVVTASALPAIAAITSRKIVDSDMIFLNVILTQNPCSNSFRYCFYEMFYEMLLLLLKRCCFCFCFCLIVDFMSF